jgi:hypothetical protein
MEPFIFLGITNNRHDEEGRDQYETEFRAPMATYPPLSICLLLPYHIHWDHIQLPPVRATPSEGGVRLSLTPEMSITVDAWMYIAAIFRQGVPRMFSLDLLLGFHTIVVDLE